MPNRLSEETSPYLLQHADNPVHWQPWGPDAMREAAERDVPLLVSIGYSACHWCHVMEHESFSDQAIAESMNANFVCIKVDREERPDVDAIFMDACQAMTGHGGWPLNAFATPDGKPFWAGTYFPPQPRSNMPSWTNVLDGLASAWAEQRDELVETGSRVASRLGGATGMVASEDVPGVEVVEAAMDNLRGRFDPQNGGFGPAPKFPSTEVIEFLLSEGETRMSVETLHAMAGGGIHDQLGGGFARYAVDATWTVPHFEKMLYDNALLARAYLHGWQVSGDEGLLNTAGTTLDWMLRELQAPSGGFHSALDADDSEGEGRFYSWTPDLVAQALPDPADAAAACQAFGITDVGNYEDGLSVPVRAGDHPNLDRLRHTLLEARSVRPRPSTDTKIIAGWNALAISALADAGAVLGDQTYLDAATACAEHLLSALRDDRSQLLRCLRKDSGVPGVLEDNAFLLAALLDLYEATFDERWFTEALTLAASIWNRFGDPTDGGFYSTAIDAEQLAARRKDIEDHPIPSGQSAMAVALLRLHALTGQGLYLAQAEGVLKLLSSVAERAPLACGRLMLAISVHAQGVNAVAIIGPDPKPFLEQLRSKLRRNTVVACAANGDDSRLPLIKGRTAQDGITTAYVCRDFACQMPVIAPADLARQLGD
ncbi:MAG: thioredoxin domain-containing protein [Actinomycetes bacterium]